MQLLIGSGLLVLSLLLIAAIAASKTSGKLGVPALILFLAIGILAGEEAFSLIRFNSYSTMQSIGIVALTIILFSGGLDTRLKSVKPILWRGLSLSTIGVLGTAFTVGLLVYLFTDFSLIEGMLLGSIVASTDAAAVFSILRSKNLELKHSLRPILELESGSNDPMAFMLTLVFTFILAGQGFPGGSIFIFFALQVLVGVAIGFAMGKIMEWLVNHIDLDYDGLYSVLILAMAFLTYSLADLLKGNGFLAVYIAAVFIGNFNFIHKRSIMRFFDGLAWLMQIVVFVALGIMMSPSDIWLVLGTGVLVAFVLIFIARPAGVFLSLIPFKMTFKDRVFISWVGLRGAVPIVFASYPLIMGIDKSDTLFNIVFFVVVSSVLIQGTSFSIVAKWLNLLRPSKTKTRYPLELERSNDFHNELVEVEVFEGCFADGKTIVELKIPANVLIVLINRNNKFITPNGATEIRGGDKLLVMTDNVFELEELNSCLGINVAE
jgi:cell volume regulation protein A